MGWLWYLNLLPPHRACKRIKNKSRSTHKRKTENSHHEGGVGTGCSFMVRKIQKQIQLKFKFIKTIRQLGSEVITGTRTRTRHNKYTFLIR